MCEFIEQKFRQILEKAEKESIRENYEKKERLVSGKFVDAYFFEVKGPFFLKMLEISLEDGEEAKVSFEWPDYEYTGHTFVFKESGDIFIPELPYTCICVEIKNENQARKTLELVLTKVEAESTFNFLDTFLETINLKKRN